MDNNIDLTENRVFKNKENKINRTNHIDFIINPDKKRYNSYLKNDDVQIRSPQEDKITKVSLRYDALDDYISYTTDFNFTSAGNSYRYIDSILNLTTTYTDQLSAYSYIHSSTNSTKTTFKYYMDPYTKEDDSSSIFSKYTSFNSKLRNIEYEDTRKRPLSKWIASMKSSYNYLNFASDIAKIPWSRSNCMTMKDRINDDDAYHTMWDLYDYTDWYMLNHVLDNTIDIFDDGKYKRFDIHRIPWKYVKGEKNPINTWNLPDDFEDVDIRMPNDGFFLRDPWLQEEVQLSIN